jgi:hypothetical protein
VAVSRCQDDHHGNEADKQPILRESKLLGRQRTGWLGW